jgi:hypothetical protein
VTGWRTMPLAEAAQAVQLSAYPDAYAKWTNDAVALVDRYGADGIALDCSKVPSGSAEPAPRYSDGSWPEESCTIQPDPTTGTGCITPRTLHPVQQATAAGWPKPGCYRVDDHGEHPKRRARNFMMTSGGEASGAQKTRGDAMAAWAVANAERLGIMYLIWFRMIWTPSKAGTPTTTPGWFCSRVWAPDVAEFRHHRDLTYSDVRDFGPHPERDPLRRRRSAPSFTYGDGRLRQGEPCLRQKRAPALTMEWLSLASRRRRRASHRRLPARARRRRGAGCRVCDAGPGCTAVPCSGRACRDRSA